VRPSGHALFGAGSHSPRWRAAGLEPPQPDRQQGGRIPDNVLVFPDAELAAERWAAVRREPEEPWTAPPLGVPHDPPSLEVGTSLDAYAPLPDPVYQTGLGRLYCGDSQALMAKLTPSSVDLCFTSPPYALVRQKEYGNEMADAFVDWFMPFVHRIRRLLTPSGFFAVNLGPAWNPGSPTLSTYDIETLLAISDRLYPVYDGVWHKPGTLPGPAQWVTIEKVRLTQATERIWIFSKDSNGPYHRRCRRHRVAQHPARFPPALPAYFIERLTQPGGHVLDPFGGSNTTGHVAESLGRRWTTIELDPTYCRNSWLRFSEEPLVAA
jgi:DNA modification methylase